MAEVMGGDQDGAPLAAELKKQLRHQLLGADIHPVEGLIK